MIITTNLQEMIKNNPEYADGVFDRVAKLIALLSLVTDDLRRGNEILDLCEHLLSSELEMAVGRLEDPLPCRSGCAACCCQWVGASQAETAVVVDYINRHNITVDMDRLRAQCKFNDPDEYWSHYGELGPCVFLGDDKLCRIYDVRPLVCRGYYVAERDNSKCVPGMHSVVRVIGLFSVETCISAMANVEGEEPFKSFQSLLLERLDK